jgi:GPH family glycoside/pentoside/hexuronide:cation symporter
MGYVIDKTKSKHGKARPWLLWLCVPFAVAAVLLFMVPNVSSVWQIVYIVITYNIVCLIYTALNVPYGTLNSLITQDQYERSVLNVFRMSFTMIGILIVSNFTLPLANMFGGGQSGWVFTFLLFGSIGAVLFFVTFKTTKERVKPVVETEKNTNVPLKDSLKTLAKNKYWSMVTLFIIVTFIWNALNAGSLIFFAQYALGNTALVGVIATVFTVFTLIGMVVVAPLTKRFGKRNAVIVGIIITLIGYGVMLIDVTNVTLLIVGAVIRGIGKAPVNGSMFSLLADTIEYGEWKTGIRNEGMVYSGGSMGIKIGSGLGTAIIGWVLAFGGYIGGQAEQAQSAIVAINSLFIYIPMGLCVVLFLLIYFYDLDKKYPKIIAELANRSKESTSH